MTEKLPAEERVRILTDRLAALMRGAGDHAPSHRVMMIAACADSLAEAETEMRRPPS